MVLAGRLRKEKSAVSTAGNSTYERPFRIRKRAHAKREDRPIVGSDDAIEMTAREEGAINAEDARSRREIRILVKGGDFQYRPTFPLRSENSIVGGGDARGSRGKSVRDDGTGRRVWSKTRVEILHGRGNPRDGRTRQEGRRKRRSSTSFMEAFLR